MYMSHIFVPTSLFHYLKTVFVHVCVCLCMYAYQGWYFRPSKPISLYEGCYLKAVSVCVCGVCVCVCGVCVCVCVCKLRMCMLPVLFLPLSTISRRQIFDKEKRLLSLSLFCLFSFPATVESHVLTISKLVQRCCWHCWLTCPVIYTRNSIRFFHVYDAHWFL